MEAAANPVAIGFAAIISGSNLVERKAKRAENAEWNLDEGRTPDFCKS